MKPFDLVVITARDPAQRQLFEWRLGAMNLSAWTRQVLVVADPPGPQPGSGGSTLYTLAAALDHLGIAAASVEELSTALGGYRLALVHCGGLSQRIPQFAALGKAFAPIDPDPEGHTVFAAVLEGLAVLAEPMAAGVMVACGDVVYRGSAPEMMPPDRPAVWAWPATLEQASRHGVFQWEADTGEALRTLQKPSVERLRAVGFEEKAPLDTGVLCLPPPIVAQLLSEAAASGDGALEARVLAARERWQGLDLYGQLIPAFVAGTHVPAFPWLAGLGDRGLRVFCPADGEFLHFGTTPELLAILRPEGVREPTLINTTVAPTLDVDKGCVLVHCRIRTGGQVGANSLLLGLDLRHAELRVRPRSLLYALPITTEGGPPHDVAVGMSIDDDPKGDATTRLLDKPLLEWATERGLSPADLWEPGTPEAELRLWSARLFPVGGELDLARRLVWLQGTGGAGSGACEWPRLSLAEIQQRFDGERWWRYECELRAQLAAEREP